MPCRLVAPGHIICTRGAHVPRDREIVEQYKLWLQEKKDGVEDLPDFETWLRERRIEDKANGRTF